MLRVRLENYWDIEWYICICFCVCILVHICICICICIIICICISNRQRSSPGWSWKILETLCNDSSTNALNRQVYSTMHSVLYCNVLKCNVQCYVVYCIVASKTPHAAEECTLSRWVWKFSGRCILCYITQVSTFSAQLMLENILNFQSLLSSQLFARSNVSFGGKCFKTCDPNVLTHMWATLGFCKL